MFRQRVYAIGCDTLASPSTLCRFENQAQRKAVADMNALLVDRFIEARATAPKEIILDFDATDDAVHGNQEGRFFHGYYDHYCFLPLYVFCDSHLLCAYLRLSKIDGAKRAWAILALLTKRIRQTWPDVKIIFRGDSGFCRWKMLQWCESHGVEYIVGIGGNKRLKPFGAESEEAYEQTSEKQRLFGEFNYAAATWDRERRVIIKAEHTSQGANTRFILTSLEGDSQALYDEVYCARGDMENRIKEQQLDLYADRTALRNTYLAQATSATIRNKLIRIGAVIIRNTRRIRFHLSTAYPRQELFTLVSARLQ
jgi:hypothetical protein